MRRRSLRQGRLICLFLLYAETGDQSDIFAQRRGAARKGTGRRIVVSLLLYIDGTGCGRNLERLLTAEKVFLDIIALCSTC